MRILRHERVIGEAQSGSSSELIDLVAGQGSQIDFVYKLPPAKIIAELQPSVWIRAPRKGLQLHARAVFPHTLDPRTGSPLTVRLAGDVYSQVEAWQQLRVSRVALELQRQIRRLRTEIHTPIDIREAFVDQLILNVYGGPGQSRVWIDELEVVGHVAGEQSMSVALATPLAVEIEGPLLTVNRRPLFLRMIRYNGEPLEQLKELGFNAVYLSGAADSNLVREARGNDLFLVCGSPVAGSRIPGDRSADWNRAELMSCLLAWSAEGGRSFPPATGPSPGGLQGGSRPVVGFKGSSAAGPPPAGGSPDIVIVGRRVAATPFSFSHYAEWVAQHSRMAGGRPLWVRVPLDPDEHWEAQVGWGMSEIDRLDPEPDQVRLAVYHAIASGARGIFFDTRRPLQGGGPGAQLRQATLRLINHELTMLEPWLAGSHHVVAVHQSQPDLRVARVETDRSQMLMVIRQDEHRQFVCRPVDSRSVSLVTTVASSSNDAFQVRLDGLRPLRTHRGSGGVHIAFNSDQLVDWIVMTQDPLALTHLSRHLDAQRASMADLHRSLAFHWLGRTAETTQRLAAIGKSSPQAEQTLRAAETQLQSAAEAGAEKSGVYIVQKAREALELLAQVRFEQWRATIGDAAPESSPFFLSYETLPLHWTAVQRIQRSRWGPNLLPGANLESRLTAEQFGWRNLRATDLQTHVEFAAPAYAGAAALRLACWAAEGRAAPAVVERPPVRVESAPVEIRRGQLVRVSGWTRRSEVRGSADGLRISDTIGGAELGITPPPSQAWQHFVVYRVATQDAPLRLTIELTGLGEAWVDELSVSVLQ